MNIVTLDFETYFDKDYTLSKLSTEAYVRDPRFEPCGCAVRGPNGHVEWFPPLQLRQFFDYLDWSRLAILCHHTQFDGLILSHYYRVKPALWLDTLSMSRLVHGNHMRNGLDALAKHYALPAKSVPYTAFKGRHWDELSGLVQHQLSEGGMHDVRLTWELFTRLAPYVPDEELKLIDLTVRMFVEPCLRGDVKLLTAVVNDETRRKAEMMAALAVERKELQSPERFAELLRAQGIDPPTKVTAAGKAYCFAKSDKFMQETILEHPDDRVRTLGEARLGVKSTIEQTRAARLAAMAERGALPVYLAYSGAHTKRWAGGDRVNWQNFRRGSRIRTAIRAPTGHCIIKADKSQIECRYLNYLAKQWDVIERFKKREDPYVAIASAAYGEPVYKPKEDDPRYSEMLAKRGTGKQLELSCGYGAGAATIQATAAKGTYGPPVKISLEQAMSWRNLYRSTHKRVVEFWYQGENALHAIAHKLDYNWSIFQIKDGKLYLPNGTCLQYPGLSRSSDEYGGHWRYDSRIGRNKIWGGVLVENVIQAVSRVDMGQCMLRLADMGYRIVLMEHDAIAVVVREKSAERDLKVVLEEMRRPPAWLPDIPLDAEATVGETYS
jgi:DNA polymerase family A